MRRILEFANPRNRGILTYLYELRNPGDVCDGVTFVTG